MRPTTASASASASNPAIELTDIRIAYGTGAKARTVVDGVSLQQSAGTLACLLGPSGCGKTSLLRAVAGLEPLLSGSIRVNGRSVASPGVHMATEQRNIGLVFQELALFPHLTVADNIAFGLRGQPRGQVAARVTALLALVGLPTMGNRYPHELSGGQQQRIALARALAPAPALLLMDEPFSSLDPDTRQTLAREVRQMLRAAGQTALMVTHDTAEAEALGDYIGTMRSGRLIDWSASGRTAPVSDAQPTPTLLRPARAGVF